VRARAMQAQCSWPTTVVWLRNGEREKVQNVCVRLPLRGSRGDCCRR